MDSSSDEHEYGPEHIPMFQKVVDMFEGQPEFQRIVRLGILADMGYYEDTGAEVYDLDRWPLRRDSSRGHGPGLSTSRLSSSSPQPRPGYDGAKNAIAGILGASKEEEKAEKKRLKRKKRKERKRIEKEKEQKVDKNEEKEKEKKAEKEKPKSDVKEQAAAKESDGSDESEDEEDFSAEDFSGCEELDMMSTFVSQVRSKLEQKPKAEKERRIPAKEPKSSPEKPKRDAEAGKTPAPPSGQSIEGNVKTSTQFANLGNSHANGGNFKQAVLYYTQAIKHNPREYRLFGNRSFCFERMRLYMKALDDAELSLIMCPGWVKGLFRKGKALAGLKRYEEAERAFRQVLQVDGSRADAAQELMRVQMAQVMAYGFTAEQSAHAVKAHKSVKNALHFLSDHHQAANASSSSSSSMIPHAAAETGVQDKRLPASQNSHQQKELYPVWVGNLFGSVTENSLEQLFEKVGPVDSVRLLTHKRCSFVNFTNRDDCEEAIRRFNGFDLNGTRLAVRYPDRIPAGMGISRAALTSDG